MYAVTIFFSVLYLFASLTDGIFADCSNRRPSATCLFTPNLPTAEKCCSELRCMPVIGNGYVATIISSDSIHVAGLFNGKANVESSNFVEERARFRRSYFQNDEHTHRARIPNTISVNFTLNLPGKRSFALDIAHGVFYQWFQSDLVEIEQSVYAHRVYKHVMVNEISISAKQSLVIHFKTNHGESSSDIKYTSANRTLAYDVLSGQIKDTEVPNIQKTNVTTVWTRVPNILTINKSDSIQTIRFITVITTSLEYQDPTSEAVKIWNEVNLKKDLFSSHKYQWSLLWQDSNITITDQNMFLPQLAYSSLYNIISSIRDDWPFGVSPGGLAGGEEYLGHSFWDQDIWMFPTILMMFPNLAKALLKYRHNRLEAAEHIAKKFGYQGTMYPWESALTGYEVCPAEVYGHHEIHITGDIAFAVQQYYLATGDLEWIKQYGFDIIYKSAEFWASRVVYDEKKKAYVINDVMPPDEYQYPVNNSFYTNTVAKLNLDSAIKFSSVVGTEVPSNWKDISEKMYLPYDPAKDYHPEFEGFNISSPGVVVKQADVILTNFPLMMTMADSTIKNDLTYYDRITDADGPAMTHSMFSIGWLQVGNTHKASQSFEKNFENVNGPFRMWSELKEGGGAKNFITAAGGFLQSLVFGYGGIRLKYDGLHFDIDKPSGSSYYQLNGIKYHGNSLSFVCGDKCYVTLTSYATVHEVLQIVDNETGKAYHLYVQKSVFVCKGVVKVLK